MGKRSEGTGVDVDRRGDEERVEVGRGEWAQGGSKGY